MASRVKKIETVKNVDLLHASPTDPPAGFPLPKGAVIIVRLYAGVIQLDGIELYLQRTVSPLQNDDASVSVTDEAMSKDACGCGARRSAVVPFGKEFKIQEVDWIGWLCPKHAVVWQTMLIRTQQETGPTPQNLLLAYTNDELEAELQRRRGS